jgi:hypothetical protein
MKAFPHKVYLETTDSTVQNPVVHAGMDLRDYFAAKALPAILEDYINESRYIGEKLDFCNMYSEERIAQIAYAMADAMMKAREA